MISDVLFEDILITVKGGATFNDCTVNMHINFSPLFFEF